jgi:hypothetical protein
MGGGGEAGLIRAPGAIGQNEHFRPGGFEPVMDPQLMAGMRNDHGRLGGFHAVKLDESSRQTNEKMAGGRADDWMLDTISASTQNELGEEKSVFSLC